MFPARQNVRTLPEQSWQKCVAHYWEIWQLILQRGTVLDKKERKEKHTHPSMPRNELFRCYIISILINTARHIDPTKAKVKPCSQ